MNNLLFFSDRRLHVWGHVWRRRRFPIRESPCLMLNIRYLITMRKLNVFLCVWINRGAQRDPPTEQGRQRECDRCLWATAEQQALDQSHRASWLQHWPSLALLTAVQSLPQQQVRWDLFTLKRYTNPWFLFKPLTWQCFTSSATNLATYLHMNTFISLFFSLFSLYCHSASDLVGPLQCSSHASRDTSQ